METVYAIQNVEQIVLLHLGALVCVVFAAWAALGMMIDCIIATIYDPVRMSEAASILMAQYLALPGLAGA